MPLAAVRVGHELPVREKIVPSSLDIPVAVGSSSCPWEELGTRRRLRGEARERALRCSPRPSLPPQSLPSSPAPLVSSATTSSQPPSPSLTRIVIGRVVATAPLGASRSPCFPRGRSVPPSKNKGGEHPSLTHLHCRQAGPLRSGRMIVRKMSSSPSPSLQRC